MKGKIKFLAVVLTLILLIGASTAIAFAADLGGEGEEPAVATLRIQNFNLSLENAVFMNFKVSSENVENVKDIKLLAWDEAPAEYRKGTETVCLDSEKTEEPTGYEVFQYTDLAAKDMTKTVYVCAYVNVDGVEAYSEPAKFSIAMYAYLKKNAATPDGELVKLLDAMLAYGAAAQTYFDHRTDFLANATTYQIDVVNGKLEDGFAKGWYPQGASVTLTANAPESGYRFSHWENSAGEQVGTTETLTLTATATEKYTAVYVEEFSKGLEYSWISSSSGGWWCVEDIGTCTDTDIVIPSTFLNAPVKYIDRYAFDNQENINSIKIPDSIEWIGEGAFYNSGIESVEIGGGVMEMSSLVFAECKNLKNVVIKNGTTMIGDIAFAQCDMLESIVLPESVKSIGKRSFEGCSSLKNVNIPYGITQISYSMFGGCSNLKSVEIPNSVTKIDDYAFTGCANLTNVSIPNSVTTIGMWAFGNCTGLIEASVGDGVTLINHYAFVDCIRLEKIAIGSSVASIGGNAFSGCIGLKNVYIKDISKWCEMEFDDAGGGNPFSYAKYLYVNEELARTLVIPIGTKNISKSAFWGIDNIENIIIEDGVMDIGDFAFFGCDNIKSVVIASSVSNIGFRAFYACNSLNSVYYKGTEAEWSEIAINSSGNENLTNAIHYYYSAGMPTTEGNYWCYVNGEVSKWEDVLSVFNMTNTEDSCTLVGVKDKNATSFPIPDCVIVIANSAFSGCTNLEVVVIPDSVTTIEAWAFSRCGNLKSVIFGENVKTIGKGAFQECVALEHVTISNCVVSLGEQAFYGCTNLASITIANSVTSIDALAFYRCSSLSSIYYIGTESEWAQISIGKDNTGITNATIYFYTETQPTTAGNYWHYVDGEPTVW